MRLPLIVMLMGLLAVSPALAAAPTEAPAQVDLPAAHGVIHALIYRPEGEGPFPAVIALHGCAGLAHDGAIMPRYRDWAEFLVKAGKVVLFPDSYGSRNVGSQCHAGDRRIFARRQRVGDILAARRWLLHQPFVSADHIGLLGWANGASALLWAVRPQMIHQLDRDFRSAVAFYPDCRTSSRLGWSTRVPMLLLIGDKDDVSSPAACREMIDDARGRSALARIVVYPRAGHAFDEPKLEAHPESAHASLSPRGPRAQSAGESADAQARVLEWFAR